MANSLVSKASEMCGGKVRLVIAGLLILLLMLLPVIITNEFYRDIMIVFLVFATGGQAWNLVAGYAGQFSLAHSMFFGLGAYTSSLLFLNYGISPWIGMIMGGILSMVASLLLYPSFRLRGTYFALSSVAIMQVAWMLTFYFRKITFGGTGISIENKPSFWNFIFESKVVYIYIGLALLAIVTLVIYFIRHSRMGYQLLALREDPNAAESLGIPTTRCKLWALLVSAFFTALAGTLYVQYQRYVHPELVMNLGLSIQFCLMGVLGGMGTLLGPIVGTSILVPSDSLLRAWLGTKWAGAGLLFYGILVIVVVRFMPRGIMGSLGQSARGSASSLIGTLLPQREVYRETLEGKQILPSVSPLTSAIADPEQGGYKIMEVEHLTKKFAGVVAIDDLSFFVLKGERLGIIGPNGAGKTTLFNLITGFQKRDTGTIIFRNEKLPRNIQPHQANEKGIARTFQVVKPFPELSVLDNLVASASAHSKSISEARDEALNTLEFVKLTRFRNHWAKDLPIGALKQLELGRALLTRPSFLMLDEVMGGLSSSEADEILSLITRVNETGVTILCIEHIMRVIMSFSQRIIVLDHGTKIAEGSPAQVSNDQKVIEAYLGKEYVDARVS